MDNITPRRQKDYPITRQQSKLNQFYSFARRRWYLLFLISLVGAVLGYLYGKMKQPVFRSSSMLLYNAGDKPKLSGLFGDYEVQSKNSSIQNQVALLTSNTISYRAIKKLGWINWIYKKGILGDADLYQHEPFSIRAEDDFIQTTDVPVTLTVVSTTSFTIKATERVDSGGIKKIVRFNQNGQFGAPVINPFFRFIISVKDSSELKAGDSYKIIFNDPYTTAIEYLKKLKIKVNEDNGDILQLEIETSPETRGIDYLNELGNQYIQYGLEKKELIANNIFAFIDRQISGISDSLKISGNNISTFRSSKRTVDLEKESTVALENIQETDKKVSLLRLRLAYYQNVQRYLENNADFKNAVNPTIGSFGDPNINNLALKLEDLHNQRASLAATVQPKNPALIDLDRQINDVIRNIRESLKIIVDNTILELNTYEQQKSAADIRMIDIPRTQQALSGIQKGFQLNDNLFTFLMQKKAEAGIMKASRIPDAEIIDSARLTSSELVRPVPALNILTGFFAVLFLCAFIIFLRIYTSNKLMTPGEIDEHLDLYIAGCIPHSRKGNLPANEFPSSGISEAFRGLKISILRLLQHTKVKVIGVHSATAKEGKTFIASNLAVSFARTGNKVVLLDGNLRNPYLQAIFSATGPGISEYFRGNLSPAGIIQHSAIENLDLIFAGEIGINAYELLGPPLLDQLISYLKQEYDIVIIDNSSFSSVNDARYFFNYAGVNLFVLRCQNSRYPELNLIKKLVHEETAANAVVVVNDEK